MKLITFQPLKVLRNLDKYGVYTPDDTSLEGKIFRSQIGENTAERLFLVAPSMPQVALYIDTNKHVEKIDSVSWVNHLAFGSEYKYNDNSKYFEFAIKQINKKEVYKVEILTKSKDPDEVQDIFMDSHLYDIENLSGYRWLKSKDKELGNFWETFEAFEFVETVTNCMIPRIKEATSEDFDDAIKLIRKYFRKGRLK